LSETIGDRLRKLRKQHKFTQKQIAGYLDFQQGQIAKLENDQRRLKVSSLEKLCELYNCPEEYILNGDEKYSKKDFAFRSTIKDINLNTVAKMNRIIQNIETLSDLKNNSKESDKK